jgi:hypothetical protein
MAEKHIKSCSTLLVTKKCKLIRQGAVTSPIRMALLSRRQGRAGSVAQVVKHLPNNLKALSSNPRTEEEKEEEEEGDRE